MDKKDLRTQIKPYADIPQQHANNGELFALYSIMEKKLGHGETNIKNNFEYILEHKKEVIDILLTNENYKANIPHILKYQPMILKFFISLAVEIDIPVEQIIQNLSDDRLGLNIASLLPLKHSLLTNFINIFGKENIREYLCFARTETGDILKIVHEDDNYDTNFFSNKLRHIINLSSLQTKDKESFDFIGEKIKNTSSFEEKVEIIEYVGQHLDSYIHIAKNFSISLIDFFKNIQGKYQGIFNIGNHVEAIYFLNTSSLHTHSPESINTDILARGLKLIIEQSDDWKIFYDLIHQFSTSDNMKLLVDNIDKHLITYQTIVEETQFVSEKDVLDYIYSLPINTGIIYDHIKLGHIKQVFPLTIHHISDIRKALRVYDILSTHHKEVSGEQILVENLRNHIIRSSPEDLDTFFEIIKNSSTENSNQQRLLSLFLHTDTLHTTREEKNQFYTILKEYGKDKKTLDHIYQTRLTGQTLESINNIHENAVEKDKDALRQYLYSDYLSDNSQKNELLFRFIEKYITDEITHTKTLYKTLPIIQNFITDNESKKDDVLKLWYQITKRGIEEQNAFCNTLLLFANNSDTLQNFFHLCLNTSNHSRRKHIVGFFKDVSITHVLLGRLGIEELLVSLLENQTFQAVNMKEIYASIAQNLDISSETLSHIITNDTLLKFVSKTISPNRDLQNKKLGLILSSYFQDGGKNVRSHITEQEIFMKTPPVEESSIEETQGETGENNNLITAKEDSGNFAYFDVAGVDLHIWEKLQNQSSITKHVSGITHKEQRHNIQIAFDELFDPDIYPEEQKEFVSKLYHQSLKGEILSLIKDAVGSSYTHFESLQFLRQYVHKIDTLLASIKENENDGGVYDAIISEAQNLYTKIYHSISNNNEQLLIRCEENSSHLGLLIHDGDISIEQTIRESMDLETAITYDISKILSHMRGCIGLHGNPVSNLDYLLPNRFFIFSQNQKTEKGVSDQIIILLPSPTIGPVYVMDKIYGIRNLNTIINHTTTLYNHILSHREDLYPPIFIPANVISSSGIKLPTLLTELQKQLPEATYSTIHNLPLDTTRAGYKEFNTWGGGIIITPPSLS